MKKEFISKDSKAPSNLTKMIGVFMGAILIVYGILRLQYYAIAIGAILMLALCMEKKIAIDENGLTVSYSILFINKKDIWPMEEIEEIHKELSPDGKEMALHVMRGIMSKRLIYPLNSYQDVIDFILEKNPNIHVAYIDK